MKINRRAALRQLFVISAGAAVLPACVNDKKSTKASGLLALTPEQEQTLADISATLIPTTDTPGAREVEAHLFALRMVSDCYKKDDQEKFRKGLTQFSDNVRQQYGKLFQDCAAADKQNIIAKATASKDAGTDAAYFYNTFKRLTIQAYTSSEYYLTKVDAYKLVPGKFISSVKV
ncbi:gluconate 2-dehydrogenase subunit 3 family protein [Chitinophaga lutea]|uniref:Gluconate 2-dehydrogenase subunit 3 family protein n=1 Tax=Chitinophaga lutea TaxID=2488634 RepID=A0A3N4PJG1_9BACT|nr:gluconate 2-dehydrogenase subunit 3 family protein [Chitinophaga lutea]RPE08813.1 gluconate 2-dehydrogenase subunit 3 family protein [Chitinophaga lutea]